MVVVAQLVESQDVTLVRGGSSPLDHPTFGDAVALAEAVHFRAAPRIRGARAGSHEPAVLLQREHEGDAKHVGSSTGRARKEIQVRSRVDGNWHRELNGWREHDDRARVLLDV